MADVRARTRDPKHDQTVLLAIAGWFAAHVLLLALLGGPAYVQCQGSPAFPGCGAGLGLTALSIGWVQLVYGLPVAFIVRGKRSAVAQGIFIGTGVVSGLFTVLCFGSAILG
jgi:hypothetical protein